MAIVATFAFAGNAAEALEYYRDIFGGDVTNVPFSQTPARVRWSHRTARSTSWILRRDAEAVRRART